MLPLVFLPANKSRSIVLLLFLSNLILTGEDLEDQTFSLQKNAKYAGTRNPRQTLNLLLSEFGDQIWIHGVVGRRETRAAVCVKIVCLHWDQQENSLRPVLSVV